MPRAPSPPPTDDRTSARRPLPRGLRPLLFGLGVLAMWALLLSTLTPELAEVLRLDASSSPVAQTRLLAEAVPVIDASLARTLSQIAPGIRVGSHQETNETRQRVTWRAARLDLELPYSAKVDEVVKAVSGLAFDTDWEVRIEPFYLEPFSPTVEISVRGYATHLLTLHPRLPQSLPPAAAPEQRAKIAILIDDLGVNPSALDPLWELEVPFSVAIIPFTPYALNLAEQASLHHRDVLVHLPMEPLPRPSGRRLEAPLGQLTLAMSPDDVRKQTRRAALAIPYAVGVNNHQGSAFTRNAALMQAMLEVLREERLFFVDSKTIADSVGYKLAKSLHVPTTERQVFLDNDPSPEQVLRALGRLRATALKRGSALGIGHPYATTIQVLRAWLPQAQQDGFELVPVSALVE